MIADAVSVPILSPAQWSQIDTVGADHQRAPKEHPQFWRELAKVENFDPGRSLFVDDSLGVLRAARAAGVGLIYAVRKPDSSCAARMHQEFPAVDAVAALL
jgi:putative hydrolase of the HAD superfamily